MELKKKQINQENNSKQIKIKKIKIKFKKNKKNQMIRNGIENKIQLETINVNKTIANKRRRIESKK
jgi:hypothetical protein